MIPVSILDLVPVTKAFTPREALQNSLDLARHAERLGYTRYWVAEHHNTSAIASAATAVVIAHLAAGTTKIRVGAGGIMLPNHSPLVIAEQFGTLEALYPGRIDLGLGRAAGTDQKTVRALRRDPAAAQHFPQDVLELQALLGPIQPGQNIRAIPGADSNVPLWILGSSLFGAQVAAEIGLPYAFASHFAPDALLEAIAVYRERFKPSAQQAKPHVMVGVNVCAADSDEKARHLFTTIQQSFTNLVRGRGGRIPPPTDAIEQYWSPQEKAHVEHMLTYSLVGSKDTVANGLKELLIKTHADEIMAVCNVFDHAARVRSYEILAEITQG